MPSIRLGRRALRAADWPRLAAAVAAIGALPGICTGCKKPTWSRFDRRYLAHLKCRLGAAPRVDSSDMFVAFRDRASCAHPDMQLAEVSADMLRCNDCEMSYALAEPEMCVATCGCASLTRSTRDTRPPITPRLVRRLTIRGNLSARGGSYQRRARATWHQGPTRFERWTTTTGRLPSAADIARLRAAAVAALGRRGESAAAYAGF